MKKIINDWNQICLYCGEEKQKKIEDYEIYYECDCPDSIEFRRIRDEIDKLEAKLPRNRFEIKKESVLRDIK